MTFTISKKDIAYFLVIAVLLVTTSASFLAYKAGAQESKEQLIKFEDKETEEEVLSANVDYPEDMELPFASCYADIQFRGEASDTYTEEGLYNPSFIIGATGISPSQFTDINGDGLVDYLYARSTSAIGSGVINSSFTGCVYLNNGNGWDKVYRCSSDTKTSTTTGDLTFAEFRGDCAGEPSASKQSQE